MDLHILAIRIETIGLTLIATGLIIIARGIYKGNSDLKIKGCLPVLIGTLLLTAVYLAGPFKNEHYNTIGNGNTQNIGTTTQTVRTAPKNIIQKNEAPAQHCKPPP